MSLVPKLPAFIFAAAAEMAKQTVGGKKNAAVTLANKLASVSLYLCLMFLTLVNRICVAKV